MRIRNFDGTAFKGGVPFDHLVVDEFFSDDVARQLEREYPDFDSPVWHRYDNAIEVKSDCNTWNAFPPATYQTFAWFTSQAFCDDLAIRLGLGPLFPDPGLHGGGWHGHKRGGKLNTHLDYNLHPKLGLQRKVNLIVYLNSQWRPEWGGQLGLWAPGPDKTAPGPLVKQIDPLFNRAILFDTTGESWHGLPEPMVCPPDQVRKSIAVYYLEAAPFDANQRPRGLFVPTPDQVGDPAVEQLIKDRARKK